MIEETLHILLIDDDEVDRMAVRRLLRGAAGPSTNRIDEATDAESALRMMADPSAAYDCALLDYQLPDQDGLSVLREAVLRGIKTPIIMLTGQGSEEIAVEIMKAGAADYLAKSRLTSENLAQSIRHAVRLRRAEQAVDESSARLRESEQRFRSMADSAPVMIWVAGTDGKCFYFNQQWLDFTGRTLEQETGDGWTSGVHPDDFQRCLPIYLDHFQRRLPFEMEYRLRRSDGTFRWVLNHGIPRFLPDRSFAGFIGSCIDISDRKRQEAELEQAKEAAEAANRAKDQFLAVLSHELRTPLTPVLTLVTAMENDPSTPPDVRSSLQIIRRNAELEARLIDDLLDLTRISKGKLELNLELTDAHEALDSAIAICHDDIDCNTLKLETSLLATRTSLKADPARLQQVFWNLIKNAVKFTPAGGKVLIRSEDVAGEDRIRVRVVDTGIGIEPDVLPRIFDAFEQGEPHITRRFGGLGLGLAITKALVDLHGGSLRAESEGPGHGAVFTVELPTVAAPAKPTMPRCPPDLSAERKRLLHLLMVDDHPDTARAMKRLLERAGYQVTLADTVRSAIEASQQKRFDLLISDIGLPDGSGLDLMRELAARHSIRGIALSGFGMEEDVKKSKQAGFAEHLTKPINFTKLESVIQQLIGS